MTVKELIELYEAKRYHLVRRLIEDKNNIINQIELDIYEEILNDLYNIEED